MRSLFILVLVIFIIFFVKNISLVKAASPSNSPTDIVTSNFSKSIEYFFKNTTSDLLKYYQEKFTYYQNVGKNLSTQTNVTNIYSSVVNYLYSNLYTLQKSISNYIKLITPSGQK